ncbi:MAG: molybdopterin-dependent oxidoreductase [Myxococcota bacterium]
MTTRHATCPLCEAMCGLKLDVEADRVVKIRGDPDDPLSQGALCPKAVALRDLQEDPDRLQRPLRRTDRGWEELPWKQAFDEVADRIATLRRRHGRASVATYFGNPLVHNTGGIVYGLVFSQVLGSRNTFSATSLDQLPQMLASWSMFGHQLLLPVPDLDRTRSLVIIGANPVVSNGSLVSAPGMKSRLRALQSRGGHVTVVDPRRTETAELADVHHFIRPGTDALFLGALARTLFEEHGPQLGRLGPLTKNLEQARSLVSTFVPEAISPRTGVPPEAVRAVAERLLEPGSALYGRIGICTQEFGGLSAWLVNLVNLLCGSLDTPGGMMFTTPAVDALAVASALGRKGGFARTRSRVRGLPEFGGEMPTVTLAEEIETEGEDRIRALITAAGNPVLSSPSGRRLDRALEHLDFMVAIDPYLNETTRHADYILPPVSPLERDHYDLVFHSLAVRNTAKYVPAPLKAPPGTKQDWEIFLELSRRLEARLGKPVQAQLRSWAMGLGPRRLIDLGLRLGPHGLSVPRLTRSPSGVDLGALEPQLPKRLFTDDGKIDAAPALYAEDIDRLRASLERPPLDLVLIGRRELRSNNSWMHNAPTLVKGPPRCTLRMHPADADARNLVSGELVEIRTEVGAVTAPLQTSEELMPGVVSLPHGYGHDREGTRQSVAEAHAGVSINDILDSAQVDELTGNAVLSGQAVEVRRADVDSEVYGDVEDVG